MPPPSRRLPHVIPPAQLARLLCPTYAAVHQLEDDEAYDRLVRAFAQRDLFDEAMAGLSEAMANRLGPRTQEDAVIDRLSQGIQKRGSRVRATEATPAISAALVQVDLAIGCAPEAMRAALASEKGQALLRDGWRSLGGYLLQELLR
jgi:hypothetical protein